MATRRFLHHVFKIANRPQSIHFFRDILGMKVLRHEEFTEGCKATCNGPYNGHWSKTMIGYGPEDHFFVMELTYNYGVGSYQLGNDFQGITIQSREAIEKAKEHKWPLIQDGKKFIIEAPGGYKFSLINEPQPNDCDPVKECALGVSDLKQSISYWNDLCGMKIYSQNEKSVVLGYGDNQCKLVLIDVGGIVDHKSAFGRVAFACPTDQLSQIESTMKETNHTIQTPLVSLDTPGKASVHVIILLDPNVHEICFVGDEAFRELSQVDVNADKLLNDGMAADKSDEWFAKKKIDKIKM